MKSFLSTKPIPANERLMFAMDVPSAAEAKALAGTLGDNVVFYKLGLELFMGDGYFELVAWLRQRGKKIFTDLKLFDVPATVGRAVRRLSEHGVDFCTVHGNDALLEAAVEAKGDVGVLAVTVLTSLDEADMDDLGFRVEISDVVLSRARRALALGCDGIVSSGLEVAALRRETGDGLIAVVPGIRPGDNRVTADDQKRIVDIEEAFHAGADYIVVGRPIKAAPDPAAAAAAIQQRIALLFSAADSS